MKTYSTKSSDIKREWHILDASGKILGRVAAQAAPLLMGKHKPIRTPHLDTGDYVVIINAAQVRVTGKKLLSKAYYRHSGYAGGFRKTTLEEMMVKHPTKAIEEAVKGMLPQNRLGAAMFRKLKVYPGAEHPHQAQLGEKKKASVKDETKTKAEGEV